MTDSSQPQSKKEQEKKYLLLGKIKIPRSALAISEKILVLVILALAVNYLLPQLASIEKSVLILSSLKPWAIILAIICQFVSYLGSGFTISKCVKIANSELSAFRGLLITLASYSIGLVAGGMFGGAATTFRWVKASGGNNKGASLAASLPPIFVDIVLVFVSIFGIIFLLFVHDLSTNQAILFTLITLLLVAFSLLCVYAIRHQEESIRIMLNILSPFYKLFRANLPEEKITRSLQQLFLTWEILLEKGWRGPLLGSSINILFDMGTLFFIFIASGYVISPAILISGYGLPLLFGRMAFMLPDGIGVVESTMIALYTSLGIDNALVTVVVLTYRVFSFWLPSILGFFLLPFFNRITRNKTVQ